MPSPTKSTALLESPAAGPPTARARSPRGPCGGLAPATRSPPAMAVRQVKSRRVSSLMSTSRRSVALGSGRILLGRATTPALNSPQMGSAKPAVEAARSLLDRLQRRRPGLRRGHGHDALRPRRLPEPLLRRAEPLEPRPRARRARRSTWTRGPTSSRPTPSGPTASSSAPTGSRPRSARSTARARGSRGRPRAARRSWRARSAPSASRSRPSATSPSPTRWRPIREQAEGLVEGGVDFLMLETMRLARPGPRRPSRRCARSPTSAVVVSLTFNEEGTTALRRDAGSGGERPRGPGRARHRRQLQPGARGRCWRR